MRKYIGAVMLVIGGASAYASASHTQEPRRVPVEAIRAEVDARIHASVQRLNLSLHAQKDGASGTVKVAAR